MRIVAFISAVVLSLVAVTLVDGQNLPKVYEYFANGTTLTGLVPGDEKFTLNGKEIRLVSGAIHYFRVHPAYWRDRLRKLRATGANTLETYVAWNLHEPKRGQFDFGQGGNDMSEFLDIKRYLEIAQEEDLLVILRPGPYICSEWDYGGFPSWLQRDPEMKVRENNGPYLERVKIFMNNFLPQLRDLQFTRGGPIIALQIENEYGQFSHRSTEYLQAIKDSYDENGFNESLYFTSDNQFGGDGLGGTIPGMFQTANTMRDPDGMFERLRELQPGMPYMVMEFWSGWYNKWGDERQSGSSLEGFGTALHTIFDRWNGSVNFYMFHGGTNFAFMSGGEPMGEPPYQGGDITSYDYDAPLSEAGDYTLKYELASGLISHYSLPQLWKPDRPPQSQKVIYPTLRPQRYLTYEDLIERVPSSSKFQVEKPISMENLPMNEENGQSFGYIIYRKKLSMSAGQMMSYKGSWPRDVAFLLVDGELLPEMVQNGTRDDYWINSIKEFPITVANSGEHTIDLLVEPLSRVNVGGRDVMVAQKGIAPIHESKIEIDGEEVEGIEIIAAEFKNAWVRGLTGFRNVSDIPAAPVLLEASFNIDGEPGDTWLDMTLWNKGIVFVNGFNIGRYWQIGPQKTLYVPAPLLKTGENKISIFEQVQPHTEIIFTDTPDLSGPPAT